MLRVLRRVYVKTDVADWRVIHVRLVETRLVRQLMRRKRLRRRLRVDVMELERVHVLEVWLGLLLEVVLHVRLEGVVEGGRMTCMQAAVHRALGSGHGQRRAQA